MSNMNGGVMRSQRARVGAGYQPPALPFAQLPNPDSVLGRVYIASGVGPAPGIELIAAPGRWRPRGGRQVLAMRVNNPVTIQNTTNNTLIETIGTFPGGLVRAGQRLALNLMYAVPGWFTGSIFIKMQINGQLTAETGLASPNNNVGTGQSLWSIDVLSDVAAVHRYNYRGGSFVDGRASVVPFATVIDFSAPWTAAIVGFSAQETAVNISSATWSGGIATFNTSAVHTLAVGDKTVIASVTPAGWNIPAGAIVLTVPTTTQFTVAMAADPGAYTSGGTSSRISNMTSQSYVLELVG